MAAGHDRSGPWMAQMPAAAMLRQTNASHVTRPMNAGISARATAPNSNGTAPCHCLSSAFFASRALTCTQKQMLEFRFYLFIVPLPPPSNYSFANDDSASSKQVSGSQLLLFCSVYKDSPACKWKRAQRELLTAVLPARSPMC